MLGAAFHSAEQPAALQSSSGCVFKLRSRGHAAKASASRRLRAPRRRRIINTHLLTEYAFVLAPGGLLYTITDVEEVGAWMAAKLGAHPLFEAVPDAELAADPAAAEIASGTGEGKKGKRNSGSTWRAVFRRIATPR
jgi:Putative methyltransferase